MSITLGIVSWQEGNSGWISTLNADLNRLASAVDSVSSGNISSGSISPLALNSDNSVTLGGILAVDSTTGHFYVKPNGVDFGDLPGQADFTGGEIVRAKSDLSGLEPIPDNSIDFEKIDYAGSTGGIRIIMHNGTKPELYTQIPTGNLPQIPVENLPIYTGGGTPLTGYVMKVYASSGQIIYLYPDITANSEETNRIKWTSALTDSPMYGDEFVTQKLPNYANIGKAQEESGGEFMYPPEMSFAYKIHDIDGTPVEATSASYHGKAQESGGGEFLYPSQMSFVGKVKHDATSPQLYMADYRAANAIPTVIQQTFGSISQYSTITVGSVSSIVSVWEQTLPTVDYSTYKHVGTLYGNATVSTSVKKFGTGSLYLDGAGDYLAFADSDAFFMDSGKFAIDLWVYPTNIASGRNGLFTQYINGSNKLVCDISATALYFGVCVSNSWVVKFDGISASFSNNNWYHIAIVCESATTWHVYLNGTRIGTTSGASAVTANFAAPFEIGVVREAMGGTSTYYLTGNIDEFRISKGTDRGWVGSTITVPTSQYVSDANTSLLAHCDTAYGLLNAGVDYAAVRNSISGSQTISISRLKPGTTNMIIETI